MNTPPEPWDSSDVIAAAVRRLYEEMCQAMVDRDVQMLEDILGDNFTLTHMTGYRQPKREWLDDISTRQMEYHDIATIDVSIDASTGADGSAVLTARTLTDATIWGGRGTWRLQLRSWFERSGDDWVFSRTVASTW